MAENTERGKIMTDAYQKITDQIIAALEAGVVPWAKPWVDGPITRSYHNRAYRGINSMLLSSWAELKGLRGCWLTFRQIKKLGGSVKKGEKSISVVYWKWIERKEEDENGKEKIHRFPLCRYYNVFSICQTVGIEDPAWLTKGLPADSEEVNPVEAAEAIWANYKDAPKLRHGGNSALYSPLVDAVQMPKKSQFKSAETYYSTLFHEAVHSTGHKSRLDRAGVSHDFHGFGSETYSKEELVAEMGSAYLAGAAGISSASLIEHNAAYIQSWIRVLKGDSKLAVIAGAQAQKAADHILGVKGQN